MAVKRRDIEELEAASRSLEEVKKELFQMQQRLRLAELKLVGASGRLLHAHKILEEDTGPAPIEDGRG